MYRLQKCQLGLKVPGVKPNMAQVHGTLELFVTSVKPDLVYIALPFSSYIPPSITLFPTLFPFWTHPFSLFPFWTHPFSLPRRLASAPLHFSFPFFLPPRGLVATGPHHCRGVRSRGGPTTATDWCVETVPIVSGMVDLQYPYSTLEARTGRRSRMPSPWSPQSRSDQLRSACAHPHRRAPRGGASHHH